MKSFYFLLPMLTGGKKASFSLLPKRPLNRMRIILQRATLTWLRSESVTVFTEDCAEVTARPRLTLSGAWVEPERAPPRCWKPSRLIRRHSRVQRAKSRRQLLSPAPPPPPPPPSDRDAITSGYLSGDLSGAGLLRDSSGIIPQRTCRMCKQHWSIGRGCYKCPQFLKMTDHYYTGAGVRGGVANMDHRLEIN